MVGGLAELGDLESRSSACVGLSECARPVHGLCRKRHGDLGSPEAVRHLPLACGHRGTHSLTEAGWLRNSRRRRRREGASPKVRPIAHSSDAEHWCSLPGIP